MRSWHSATIAYKKPITAVAEGPRDALCHLKSCSILHKWSRNCTWKGLQPVHDHQNHSRSQVLAPPDRPYDFLLAYSFVVRYISILYRFQDNNIKLTVWRELLAICSPHCTSHRSRWNSKQNNGRIFLHILSISFLPSLPLPFFPHMPCPALKSHPIHLSSVHPSPPVSSFPSPTFFSPSHSLFLISVLVPSPSPSFFCLLPSWPLLSLSSCLLYTSDAADE